MRHTTSVRAPGRHRRMAAVLAATVLASAVAGTASATTVSPTNTTSDRPAITMTASGEYAISWAGTDANGTVNVASVDANGNILSKTTDTSSATYQGTGTAIAFVPVYNASFVAWTDLGTTVHVAVEDIGNGLACESTTFGSSVDTPYLTLASDGTLYLTTVDSGGVMHVTAVHNSDCFHEGYLGGANTLVAGASTAVAGNAAFDGPTLVDLSTNGTPNLWLIWAGLSNPHYINIAQFTPGNSNLGTKYVETNHFTPADLGSTYYSVNGTTGAFFTYCGTNNVVYGQRFFGTGPQPEVALGGSCDIYTNSAGYVNGGVDVTWNPQRNNVDYLFPNLSNNVLTLDSYTP